MKSKKLYVIQNVLRTTRDVIGELSEKDSQGIIINKTLRDMYYRINNESIIITKLLNELPWEK